MIARDLLLDASGDLDLTGGGALAFDLVAVAQEIEIRLRTDLGEYFLDTSRGLPFQRWIAGKWSPAVQKEAGLLVRAELLAVPGVASVEPPGVEVTFDATTKAVTFHAQVRTDLGELLEVATVVGGPSSGTSWDSGTTAWDGSTTIWD